MRCCPFPAFSGLAWCGLWPGMACMVWPVCPCMDWPGLPGLVWSGLGKSGMYWSVCSYVCLSSVYLSICQSICPLALHQTCQPICPFANPFAQSVECGARTSASKSALPLHDVCEQRPHLAAPRGVVEKRDGHARCMSESLIMNPGWPCGKRRIGLNMNGGWEGMNWSLSLSLCGGLGGGE